MKNYLYEVIGWYGALAIMCAYFLNSFGILESQGLPYQILNVSGAIGCIIIAYRKGVYQSVFLNTIWAIVGCVALYSLIF